MRWSAVVVAIAACGVDADYRSPNRRPATTGITCSTVAERLCRYACDCGSSDGRCYVQASSGTGANGYADVDECIQYVTAEQYSCGATPIVDVETCAEEIAHAECARTFGSHPPDYLREPALILSPACHPQVLENCASVVNGSDEATCCSAAPGCCDAGLCTD